MLFPSNIIEATVLVVVGTFLLLYSIYAIKEHFRVTRDIKVRNSHFWYLNDKLYKQQCNAFIEGINTAEDFVSLLRVKATMDEYFGSRPFIPNEYTLKAKVYKTYFSKQNDVLPKSYT
jgi:hypothetical protein